MEMLGFEGSDLEEEEEELLVSGEVSSELLGEESEELLLADE